MRVGPYKVGAPRHVVGFVGPDGKARMEDGSRVAISDLPPNATHNGGRPSVRLYGDEETIMGRFVMRGLGAVDVYNRTPVGWMPDPAHRVLFLRDRPGNDDSVLAGLVVFRDFLSDRGASIGSMGASTWSLLRTTLPGSISYGIGAYGPGSIVPDNMGGRLSSFASIGHFEHFAHLDMVAAYASILGDLFYDGRGEWGRLRVPAFLDSPVPQIARARIRFPRMDFDDPGPLPRRRRSEMSDYEIREYPNAGTMTGTYVREELGCAVEAGCDVDLLDVWVRDFVVEDDRFHRPFRPWLNEIMAARSLPGYAGDLGKMAGAALWGRFLAGSGWTYRYRFAESKEQDRRAVRRPFSNQRLVGYDIAELVTARCRARLWREMIVPFGDRLIGVHTDGGLIVDDDGAQTIIASMAPDWRVKYRGAMDYITPASYRYKTADEHRFTYVMSGVEESHKVNAFEEVWRAHRGTRAQGMAGAGALEIRESQGLRALQEGFPELEIVG